MWYGLDSRHAGAEETGETELMSWWRDMINGVGGVGTAKEK